MSREVSLPYSPPNHNTADALATIWLSGYTLSAYSKPLESSPLRMAPGLCPPAKWVAVVLRAAEAACGGAPSINNTVTGPGSQLSPAANLTDIGHVQSM